MRKYLFISLLFLLGLLSNAQNLAFSGTIYGFYGEKVMLLKKASKNLGFEGPISAVEINVKGIETDIIVYSDLTGAYTFSLPKSGEYIVTVSKEGYSTLSLKVNYQDAGAKTIFSLISFVIRKDDKSMNDFGTLSISDNGALFFSTPALSKKNENQDVMQSNKILFEKAVTVNNSSKQNIVSSLHQKFSSKNSSDNKGSDQDKDGSKRTSKKDSSVIKHTNDLMSSLNRSLADSASDLKKQIELSKQLLSSYNDQDPQYQMLLNQIKNAESQLALKENYLNLQKKELGQAQKLIVFMVAMIVVAILLMGLMYYFIAQKRKFNKTLTEKNTQISKINDRLISSITYASVIQSNLLMDKEQIKKLFPNSFVYYQPKDILSGDFYWFGETEGTKIIISADCTGHGVPGALLTVLGHGIIEELIEKNKLNSPSKIINELNNQLNLAFSTQNLTEYGIELTVMCFNERDKKAAFASNGNGIYKYSDGEILNYLPVIHRPIKNDLQPKYEDVIIDYKANDCFYLMSDGYCDQFKGDNLKPEKYNLRRFEALLSRISAKPELTLADKELHEEFEKWKGEREQTDDVLVVGFRA
ncbi:MAG: SpoIIE family protein phosphatase [Sphingobacteriaceae bacterium]|nr:SpoIIE family protein phosphatase [Sphingobacteriaceae bacterium]